MLEHNIDTGESVPVKSKHYPMSPPRQEEAYREIDRLLAMGVIEESNSPWCSPVVVVRKPGKIRLCLDSRKLNELTKKDSYPLPHIGGLLSRLKDTHYISGIDLKDAFFQIRLTESSKEKTAFVVPGRPLYQYKVMPFGLCNGPQTMSRLMDRVIPSRLREKVFIYLDDLLVCSPDFESHIKLLKEVAACLIRYLGYRVGNGCLKVDPEKIDAIANFPIPRTQRQLGRFIGMANWYRIFIDNFSNHSGPLTDCLKKSSKSFSLTESALQSFEALKKALCTAPVLAQPDFSREFIIQCDASRIGVGGVLFQYDSEGKEHPIAYVSQKLNKCQRNYTVTELECMAAVVCVNRFRAYIEGLPFRIITDHSSLRWLMSQKDLSGRLARWSLKLQTYDFKIEHRKGSLNTVPDTLSRVEVDELCLSDTFEVNLNAPEFNDEDYRQLLKVVSENEQSMPDLCISENLVFKRVHFRQGVVDEEDSLWRLWLPQSLTLPVIQTAHDSITSSHGGYAKTLARIKQKYFWPTMAKDVKIYIDNCDRCKTVKSNNMILRPPMEGQFVTNRPFERLYCDFLGPYPVTKNKNTCIFICLDHLTKFLFLTELKKATTSNVIIFLQTYLFPTFGVPRYLHTDNAKQFISKEMNDFLQLYGIIHIKAAFYAPQSNASERANREIITKIRIFLENKDNHRDWDRYIPQILSILRSDYHSVIKCSPYYAVFGQNIIQHASSYKILEKIGCLNGQDIDISDYTDKLDRIREKIRKNLQEAHNKTSTRADRF